MTGWKLIAFVTASLLISVHCALAEEPESQIPPGNPRSVPVDSTVVRDVRISMGNVAAPGAYPFQVLLNTRKKNGKTYMCGGALAGDATWVLTAAHCIIDDDGTVMAPYQISVFAGSPIYGGGNIILARQVFAHPAYKRAVYDNDVALLRLRTKPRAVRYGVIAMLEPDQEPALAKTDARVTVIGWGQMETGFTASRLMEGHPRLVDRAQCNKNYLDYYVGNFTDYLTDLAKAGRDYQRERTFFDGMRLDNPTRIALHDLIEKRASPDHIVAYARTRAGTIVTENMICALGSPPNFGEAMVTDACHGDSGGPLFTTSENGKPVLVGIVSWGEGGKFGCGSPTVPGIYTRVVKMSDWVSSVMNR